MLSLDNGLTQPETCSYLFKLVKAALKNKRIGIAS